MLWGISGGYEGDVAFVDSVSDELTRAPPVVLGIIQLVRERAGRLYLLICECLANRYCF